MLVELQAAVLTCFSSGTAGLLQTLHCPQTEGPGDRLPAPKDLSGQTSGADIKCSTGWTAVSYLKYQPQSSQRHAAFHPILQWLSATAIEGGRVDKGSHAI